MIVIATDLVLGPTPAYPLDTPVFGWHNLVTPQNIIPSSEDLSFPAANLGNPFTFSKWKAESLGSPIVIGAETLQIDTTAADPVDYVGIARHNFGTAQISVALDGASELTGSPAMPDWQELIAETLFANDEPIILRFDPQAFLSVRIRLGAGLALAQAAVVYCGKLLVCERGTHAQHVPISDGRMTKIVTGKSESGQYLGRIQTGQGSTTQFALKMLREAWYRETMRPFIREAAQDNPFFFAWAPQEFATDVGYCWITSDPRPSYDYETQTRSIDLALGGIAA